MLGIRRPLAVVAACAVSFLAPGFASAGPILTINNDAKGGVGQLETLTWTFNGQSETGLAGTIITSVVPGGPKFDSYCIDLYHSFNVGNGGTTWSAEFASITSFTGDVGVPSTEDAGGHGGAIGYLYQKYAAGVTTAIQGAALQIAIWKVDYDNNNSFSTGAFQFAATPNDPTTVQSQVFAQATADLAGFNGTQSSDNANYLRATSHPNGSYQDLVGANVVPEPSSIVLVMAGLVPFGLRAARARRAPGVGR